MSNYVIELDHVSCKAGRHYLLKDISWQVKAGEHWGVFGMNGSGKTTLLSIIAGFKHFTSGTLQVFGENFTEENVLAIRKRIGWVSSAFFDNHFSKESALNIVLSGKTGTLSLAEDITLQDVRLAKDLLATLDLADKIDTPFDFLSKGERQNVLIARALLPNPNMLILDEPCNGLDVYHRSYLFNTIEQLSRKKDLTIIYVTHYAEEIMPLFNKMLFLKKGTMFAKGSTKELFTDEMMQLFLDRPVHVRTLDDTYALQIEAHSSLASLFEEGARK